MRDFNFFRSGARLFLLAFILGVTAVYFDVLHYITFSYFLGIFILATYGFLVIIGKLIDCFGQKNDFLDSIKKDPFFNVDAYALVMTDGAGEVFLYNERYKIIFNFFKSKAISNSLGYKPVDLLRFFLKGSDAGVNFHKAMKEGRTHVEYLSISDDILRGEASFEGNIYFYISVNVLDGKFLWVFKIIDCNKLAECRELSFLNKNQVPPDEVGYSSKSDGSNNDGSNNDGSNNNDVNLSLDFGKVLKLGSLDFFPLAICVFDIRASTSIYCNYLAARLLEFDFADRGSSKVNDYISETFDSTFFQMDEEGYALPLNYDLKTFKQNAFSGLFFINRRVYLSGSEAEILLNQDTTDPSLESLLVNVVIFFPFAVKGEETDLFVKAGQVGSSIITMGVSDISEKVSGRILENRGTFDDILFALIANYPISTCAIDKGGKILKANELFRSLLTGDKPVGQLNIIGADILNILDDGGRQEVAQFLYEVREGAFDSSVNFVKEFECRLSKHKNTIYKFNFISNLHLDSILVFIENITDKVVLERRVKHENKMSILGPLVGHLAHNLNNQLFVVTGNCEQLIADFRTNNHYTTKLHSIISAAKKASNVVKRVLDYSRSAPISVVRVDLNKLNEKFYVDFKPEFYMRKSPIDSQVKLGKKVLKNIPNNDLKPVKIDPGSYDEIMANLSKNALEAMSDSLNPEIVISSRNVTHEDSCKIIDENPNYEGFKPGNYVCVTVKDNGPGIVDSVKDSIFEIAYSSTKEGGNGIGLASVYGIVKQMDGFIYFDSKQGEGTAFHLFFKCYEKQANEEEQKVPVSTAKYSSSNKFILVIDDDNSVRSIAENFLSTAGYKVKSFDDPLEVIDFVKCYSSQEEPISLIVTDLTMDIMTGREMIGEIRKFQPQMNFIIMSGYLDENEIALLKAPCISKPFEKNALIREVQNILGE